MNINQSYQEKNGIIFGASSFVGKTIGNYLTQQGVNLGLIDLESHEGDMIEKNLEKQNKIIYRTVKSGDQNGMEKVMEEMRNTLGNIDFLICAYYIDEMRSKRKPEDLSLETWDNIFQDWIVNYFLILKAFVPSMIHAKKGRIIFFNTTSGYTGEGEGEGEITLTGTIHESACSSGITGMMTSIAHDIIPHGISVNGIALGPDYKADPERIIWTANLWFSGLGEYSCGQIVRLY